jgi:hydrogenase nickel incorporation protein HypB
MCQTCGCSITPGNEHLVKPGGEQALTESGQESVAVLRGLLHANDHQAAHNREHFDAHATLALNLMSSPGAGKTRLLEASIDALKARRRLAVIEGDLETENDAARIRAHGVPALQITTGSACHLDAHLVHDALHHLPLAGLDLLFIENVGNLVCPASFDLGQHRNICLLSVTEGDDKPEKYPVMFRAADLVLLTKADLLPHIEEFDPARAEASLRRIGCRAPFLTLSAKSGAGLPAWLDWLDNALRVHRAGLKPVAPGAPAHPPLHHHAQDHSHSHTHSHAHSHVHVHRHDG